MESSSKLNQVKNLTCNIQKYRTPRQIFGKTSSEGILRLFAHNLQQVFPFIRAMVSCCHYNCLSRLSKNVQIFAKTDKAYLNLEAEILFVKSGHISCILTIILQKCLISKQPLKSVQAGLNSRYICWKFSPIAIIIKLYLRTLRTFIHLFSFVSIFMGPSYYQI